MTIRRWGARLALVTGLLAVPGARAADGPAAICADIADHARALLEGAKVDTRAESMDPRDPKAPAGCRVTLTGGRATGRDPLERLEHYIRERGWTRSARERPPAYCRVRRVRDPVAIEVLCLPTGIVRPALPVTRLGPAVHSESRPDDPSLIRMPDGRVIPRPSTPQSPMTDKPLDWKTKP
ncbi:MAG: hypothetical protein AABY62_02790 [Pseudomonadota bacterium]